GGRRGDGADPRYRKRYSGKRAAAHLRSVLYDERRPEPHRAGFSGGAQHCGAARGRDLGPLHSRRRGRICRSAAGGVSGRTGRESVMQGQERENGGAKPVEGNSRGGIMGTAVESPPLIKTKGRILIVDDELVVRDSLGKWFTS